MEELRRQHDEPVATGTPAEAQKEVPIEGYVK